MEFKAGDKVKVKLSEWDYGFSFSLSKEYEISGVYNDGVYIKGFRDLYHKKYFEKIIDIEEIKFGDKVNAFIWSEHRNQWVPSNDGPFYFIAKKGDDTQYQYLCSICDPTKRGGDGFIICCFSRIEKYVKAYTRQEIANALKIDVKDLKIEG